MKCLAIFLLFLVSISLTICSKKNHLKQDKFDPLALIFQNDGNKTENRTNTTKEEGKLILLNIHRHSRRTKNSHRYLLHKDLKPVLRLKSSKYRM